MEVPVRMKQEDYAGFLWFFKKTLIVIQRSGLMSMTNSAINSTCDIPYSQTLCLFHSHAAKAGFHIMTKTNTPPS